MRGSGGIGDYPPVVLLVVLDVALLVAHTLLLLAPTLFALYLAAMLYEIPTDNPGVEIKYRLNGGLFNLPRLRSQRLTNITRITELQYADDNATPAHSPEEIQQSVNNFKQAYECFGLTINANKTKVLAQPTPGAPIPDFNIFLGDTPLEQVDHFSYLGSVLSSQCNSEKDVDTRIHAAHVAFGRLYHRVFGNKNLKQQTKLMVYHAVVISTLLYGYEAWTLYSRKTRTLSPTKASLNIEDQLGGLYHQHHCPRKSSQQQH